MLLPPFDQDTPLFRGNLHGHTSQSDGLKPIDAVISSYRDLGYDFIALSDHLWHDTSFAADCVTDGSHLISLILLPCLRLNCIVWASAMIRMGYGILLPMACRWILKWRIMMKMLPAWLLGERGWCLCIHRPSGMA